MRKNNILKYLAVFILTSLCISCNNKEKDKADDSEPYFEGEITLAETRGLYGSLFKVHTTYLISENSIKREQKLGGINSVLDNYAGIIIDLKKDSVVLYYSDQLSGIKNKHTTSLKDYKSNAKYKSFPSNIPSPVDNTFQLLPDYNLIKQVKDSITIKGFKSDYTLYKDSSEILKQQVFDTKGIKVKREFLQMVFNGIPEEINFPLKSDLTTTLSDIRNDSILNGQQSKAIDLFLRDVFQKKQEKTDLEKLSKNKWVNLGLEVLKKGVDLNIHITADVSELTVKKLTPKEFLFPSNDFKEISDIDEFINTLPSNESGEYDD